MFVKSLELMLFGLIGVFGALGLLWASVKAMTWLFPSEKSADDE